MKIESSGWATIESAPHDRPVIVWGSQRIPAPDAPQFAAIARFDDTLGWVSYDPTDHMVFQLDPTHWLPVPPPPTS